MGKIAIILGAGATRGSGYKLRLPDCKIDIPIDEDFLKVVFENEIHTDCLQRPSGKLLYDSFKSLMEEFRIMENERVISDIGLEEIWNTVVLNNKFIQQNLIQLKVEKLRKGWEGQSESPEVKLIKRADFFLRLLVQRVYGRIDYNDVKDENDSYKKLFSLLTLTSLSKEVSFLTFNYDLCVENSLWRYMGNEQYFYYPNFDDNYIPKNFEQYPIYKLHGSLNWWHGYDGFIRLKREKILEPNLLETYFQERSFESWKRYQPAIIPMDFLKEELHHEEGQVRLHRHYLNLWAKAGRELEEAEKIIIIGYSFPPADPHVRWLMRASRCNLFGENNKNNKSGEKHIFFITKSDDKTEQTKNTIKAIFENEPKICKKGFEHCSDDLMEWLKKISNKTTF